MAYYLVKTCAENCVKSVHRSYLTTSLFPSTIKMKSPKEKPPENPQSFKGWPSEGDFVFLKDLSFDKLMMVSGIEPFKY
ncbi:MAG: hypothetical protein Q7S62_01630 [bacterium]|nr:hypothetical protein [bacterium]